MLRTRTATPGKIYMSSLDFSATNYRQETGSRLSGGRKDSGWIRNAYEVDVKNGKAKLIASGSSFTREYLVDYSGEKIVRSDFNGPQHEQSILVKEGISWRNLYRTKQCGELDLRGFSADGAAVLALGSTCDDGHNKLWSIPLDGTAMKSVFDDPALEIEGTLRDSTDGKVLAVSLGGQQQTVRWLDPEAERRSKALHKSFGARWITFVSRSADNQKIVVLVEDETHPPIHYLVDYSARKADILNEAYPLLAGVKLGTVRDFNYEARDKYALTGYLTLPADAAEKNLPLVVMPHGGPEARDETGFDWLAQFLASRGYAVLQPQFRGSTGRGRAHADAGPASVGPAHAGRCHRRSQGADHAGHRRSKARLYRRLELWRLRSAGRCRVHSRPVRLRGKHRRRIRLAGHARRRYPRRWPRIGLLCILARTHRIAIRPERHREITGASLPWPCAHRYCCCMERMTPWSPSSSPASWRRLYAA